MGRKQDLPVILSHNTQTGVMVFPNRKMCGKDMVIVGLNKEIESGKEFEMQDIKWVKAVLHFGDVPAMETTVEVLAKALEAWKKEANDGR